MLRRRLPSVEELENTRVDPRGEQERLLRELREAARKEEHEARRRALESTLRAETLADIRRRS